MVLHELCTALNAINKKAGIIFITEGSQDLQNFKFGYSESKNLYDPNGMYYDYFTGRTNQEINDYIHDSVVIYPDIIRGNPLNARRCATYVLGFPKFEIKSDFIISYAKNYISNPDSILYKPFISEYMHSRETPHWSQRNLSLTYFGKGPAYADCTLVPGTVLIERDWPRDKQQLALLLRQCKYFFSWDSLSATNIDAVLCGAVPILMQDKQLPRSVIDSLESGPLPTISYSPGMDTRSTPVNVAAIDTSMRNIVENLEKFKDSWQTQVINFCKQIECKI